MLDQISEIYLMPSVLILCTIGVIGHVYAICVFRKMMNPMNLLMISMSCNQLMLCVSFLYSTVFKFASDQLCFSSLWTFGWTSSFLLSVNFSIILEMCAVFHVVAISVVRYLSLDRIIKSRSSQPWFDYQKCWRVLIIIYGIVVVGYAPLYFHSEVKEVVNCDYCIQKYPQLKEKVKFWLRFADNEIIQLVNFCFFGFICKIIPCAILCIMSILLVDSLSRIHHMSARFASVKRDRRRCRTTKIILIIMLIFICVELPQGILAIAQSMTAVPYHEFLGDIFEILTLLASCIIFALFCSMSSGIRRAVHDLKIKFCIFINKIDITKRVENDLDGSQIRILGHLDATKAVHL